MAVSATGRRSGQSTGHPSRGRPWPSAATRRGPDRATRVLAAILAGLALALAFPPYDLAWLAPLAVAALAVLCWGRDVTTGALAGLAFGVGFFALLTPWLRIIGTDAWLALAAVEGGFYIALGIGLALTGRLPGRACWAAAACVAVELARAEVPLGGFPWGRLAFAVVDTPLAPYARLGGAPLVTLAVALVGGLLASASVAVLAHPRFRFVRAALRVAAAAAVTAGGLLVPLGPAGDGTTTAVAAVVQGNVPGSGLDAFAEQRAVLDNHVSATHRLADRVAAGGTPRPDLVIWPENSTDIDPYADPTAAAEIDRAVADIGVPTLVGAVTETSDGRRLRNLGVVWEPGSGPGAGYVKRHPVPFGEYVPFRDLLAPYVERLDQIPRDFVAGTRPGVLSVGPVVVGDLICFEVAYDDLVADVVRGGAQVLVVQTNNATYGRTGQPEQQFAISRLRAIETGRAVLVAATTGISGIVAADGTVVSRTDQYTSAALVERVPLAADDTPATEYGAAVEVGLASVAVLAALGALASSRVRRRRAAGEEG